MHPVCCIVLYTVLLVLIHTPCYACRCLIQVLVCAIHTTYNMPSSSVTGILPLLMWDGQPTVCVTHYPIDVGLILYPPSLRMECCIVLYVLVATSVTGILLVQGMVCTYPYALILTPLLRIPLCVLVYGMPPSHNTPSVIHTRMHRLLLWWVCCCGGVLLCLYVLPIHTTNDLY